MFQNTLIKNMQVLNKFVYSILISVSTCCFVSCSNTVGGTYNITSNSDAENFIEKERSGNTYEKKIKDVNIKLIHISNEEIALKQTEDVSKINQAKFDSLVRNYDSLVFFNLEISIDDFNEELLKYKLEGDIDAAYNERVDYYAFKMQKDINIVLAEKDTIPCVLYHFERSYGISPKTDFMIGFKLSKFKDAVFVYDNTFLKTGIIKFALNEQELLNHPHIKIN